MGGYDTVGDVVGTNGDDVGILVGNLVGANVELGGLVIGASELRCSHPANSFSLPQLSLAVFSTEMRQWTMAEESSSCDSMDWR